MSLPSGYKRLEYIQSSGKQYINTGFKPNNNTRVVMDLLYTGSESISNEFGAWNSSNNASFISLTTGKNNLYPFYGNTSKQVSADRTARHTVDMDKNVVKMNGTTMITFNQMSFQCIYPMFLCCFNNAGATENMTSIRIYSCQIYDNGTLVRNFIPCQTTSWDIGLWDDANSVFYGNAGTGTFTAGPVSKPDAPSDLTSSVDDGTVTLSWSAVSGVTGYKISRDGVLISTQTGLTYTETVTKGQTYTYSIVAYNDYVDSDPATLSVNVPLVPPSTPSNFASSVSGLSATLSWDAPAKATGYRLYRDGVLLSDQTDTGYTDAVEPFVSYVYTLIAYNDDGESGQATVSVLVIIPPAAPQNFMVLYAGMQEISLSWSAVTGADSYELKRGGTTVYTGSDTAYTDSHLKPETDYTYSLTAINTAGTSLEVTLETATMGLVLITDRTKSDVINGTEKGSYNASDLNRVGAAMNYVADRLRAAGYDPHISPKTDWKDGDWMTPTAQAVYLGDLAELRKQFELYEATPEVPPRILATGIRTNDGLTYVWANNIEQILVDIDALLTNIAAGWLYSGEIYSGEV